MKTPLDLLRAKEPTTAELRAALDALPVEAAVEARTTAQATRRQQLIDGVSGAAVEATERAIADAQRECDRLLVLGEELTARIAMAEKREALDALMIRRETADKECRAVAKAMDKDARRLLDDLLGLLRRKQAAFFEANAVNTALIAVGAEDRVSSPTGDGGLNAAEMQFLYRLI